MSLEVTGIPEGTITTVTTRNSHCLKTHTKPTQVHANGRKQVQSSQQNPSEQVSNASTLTTCPLFAKSVFSLYLLYLDSSLSSHHISIHMYPPTLRPLCPYLLCLDFWSPNPLVPDPDLVNTYSSVVSLLYYTWLAHLPGHHLPFASSYISFRYSAVVP